MANRDIVRKMEGPTICDMDDEFQALERLAFGASAESVISRVCRREGLASTPTTGEWPT